jgi:divalent metal cation (Fe/Co/Zn/Cd) transporter
MSVDQSHALTDRIADNVNEKIGKTRVTVHVEPNDGSHPVADEEDDKD